MNVNMVAFCCAVGLVIIHGPCSLHSAACKKKDEETKEMCPRFLYYYLLLIVEVAF